ncbi:L-threonylcarbamoyladenylate synthase [Mycoplasma sp. 4044]
MTNKYDDVFVTTTDTVLGLGVRLKDNNLDLLYELKQRDLTKKIIILVADIEQAKQIVEWNQKAEQVAEKYWPGAVSLIVKGQGFRMPNQPKLLEFLRKNGPCYVTSCNISNQQVAKNLEEAKKIFPQLTKFYDFGELSGQPSKIIDLDNGKIIRE